MKTRLNLTALEDRCTPSAAVLFPAERLAAWGLDPSRVAALTFTPDAAGTPQPTPVVFAPADAPAPVEIAAEPAGAPTEGPLVAQVESAPVDEAPAPQPVNFGTPVSVPISRLNPFVNPARSAALTFAPAGDGSLQLVPVNFVTPAPAPAEPEQTVGTQNAVLPQSNEPQPTRTPGATFFDTAAGRWRVAGGVSIGLTLGDDGIARPIVVD